MENRQARKGKGRNPAATALDLRQMDMWVGGEKPGSKAGTILGNSAQVPVKPGKKAAAAAVSGAVGKRAPVKVTVSKPHRAAASFSDRSLPALTRRQHELLDFLRRRAEQALPPPSLNEVCRELGLASRGSLHKQVVALVRAGLVEPMQGKQRGVRLAPAANDADGAVPLLGAIAAGRPIEALTRDEQIVLPEWLRTARSSYALRVRGDSMRDVGILDGDIVVVEPREQARNGEMVVALIDGEAATLKRIELASGSVLLHAENPEYAPQRYAPERVQVQGVVVAQLRRY